MGYKILFIIHRMGYGGAEKIMAFLANELSRRESDVYLLTYEDMTLEKNLYSQVKHVNFSYTPSPVYAFRRLLQIFKVRKIIKQIMPDVVISFLTYPNMISIISSLGTGIPVIISERGDPSVFQSWFNSFRNIVYNFADGIVFQTHGAMNYYNKKIQAKAVVIPNPVIFDGIPLENSEDRKDIIVTVGRLELNQKRQDILIKAFSEISAKYPTFKLIFFGDGEDEKKINQIISNSSLRERIILAGVTRNVAEDIRTAKLFVLSSDFEGVPNALIEAMCLGLPCISTDCSPGGAAELIKNMDNGILVKAGCVDELAKAIEFMLENPKIAEAMGQNALKIKENLTPQVIISRWCEYIDNRIQAKSSN